MPSSFVIPVGKLNRSTISQRFNVELCIFEIAGFRSPVKLTADFSYVRLHGPGEKAYQGKYSESQHRGWAKTIQDWTAADRSVYFYFDNDQAGFAAQSALELSRMRLGKDLAQAG